MYKDVMSPHAFGRYNIYLVQLIGLEAAVYWEQLYAISDLAYSKCERKDTLNTKGYFTIDRKYVKERTGIATEQQRAYDRAFMKIGAVIISEDNQDALYVDNGVMLNFLTSDVKTAEKKATFNLALSSGKATIKEQRGQAKKNAMIARWKQWVTGSPELLKAYADAFSVWYSFGWQTDAMIQAKIDSVERATNDEGLKIEILRRSTQSGVKDLDAIIWRAKQDYNPLKNQKVSTGVSSQVF